MTPAQAGGVDSVQWTPSRSFPEAEYASLDKDAADLGAQLDFFGATFTLSSRDA